MTTGPTSPPRPADVAPTQPAREHSQGKGKKHNPYSLESLRTNFSSFVIQKYIERPLLYKGYKFDIRVYAVLTQTYDLYVFRYSSPHQGGLRQALESQVHTR